MNVGYIILGYGGTVLALALGTLAAWRGALQERLAVLIVLLGWFITPLVKTTYRPGLPIFILDFAIVAALFVISVYSRRLWSLMITACATANLVTHFANVVTPKGQEMVWAYVVTSDFLGGIFVALCMGVAAWECEVLKRSAPSLSLR